MGCEFSMISFYSANQNIAEWKKQFDALCSLTYNLIENVDAYNGTNLQKTISANPNSSNVETHFTTRWEPLTLKRRKREYEIQTTVTTADKKTFNAVQTI